MSAWPWLLGALVIGAALRWWWAGRQQAAAHHQPAGSRPALASVDPPAHSLAAHAMLATSAPPAHSLAAHATLATVVLHDDSTTPMDVVVLVIASVFGLEPASAVEIMRVAHHHGAAVVAALPPAEAETRTAEAAALARTAGFALRFTVLAPAPA